MYNKRNYLYKTKQMFKDDALSNRSDLWRCL